MPERVGARGPVRADLINSAHRKQELACPARKSKREKGCLRTHHPLSVVPSRPFQHPVHSRTHHHPERTPNPPLSAFPPSSLTLMSDPPFPRLVRSCVRAKDEGVGGFEGLVVFVWLEESAGEEGGEETEWEGEEEGVGHARGSGRVSARRCAV